MHELEKSVVPSPEPVSTRWASWLHAAARRPTGLGIRRQNSIDVRLPSTQRRSHNTRTDGPYVRVHRSDGEQFGAFLAGLPRTSTSGSAQQVLGWGQMVKAPTSP